MIIRCNCTKTVLGNTAGADFQDQTYGKGMRVHNESKKGSQHKGWVCTICSNLKSPSREEKPKEEKPEKETKKR